MLRVGQFVSVIHALKKYFYTFIKVFVILEWVDFQVTRLPDKTKLPFLNFKRLTCYFVNLKFKD
jgi:predicted nucleotidyltransferase